MASTAAVPFWRSAGMTYITYSNICANLVRNCLKEPFKSEAISREKVHFSVSKWADGKQQKPSNSLSQFIWFTYNRLLRSRVCFRYANYLIRLYHTPLVLMFIVYVCGCVCVCVWDSEWSLINFNCAPFYVF